MTNEYSWSIKGCKIKDQDKIKEEKKRKHFESKYDGCTRKYLIVIDN